MKDTPMNASEFKRRDEPAKVDFWSSEKPRVKRVSVKPTREKRAAGREEVRMLTDTMKTAPVDPHDLFVMLCMTMRGSFSQHHNSMVLVFERLVDSYGRYLNQTDAAQMLREIGEQRTAGTLGQIENQRSWERVAGKLVEMIS